MPRDHAADQADRASGDAPSSIVRLSREDKRGIYLLIVGAAGTSAMTYQPIVEHFDTMQVHMGRTSGVVVPQGRSHDAS